MKVLFDHPNPFFLAHGGFQTQIEQTRVGLEKVGVEVEPVRWWDDSQKGDLIHYFGRPLESYVSQCHAKGLLLVTADLLGAWGSRSWLQRFLQMTMIRTGRKVLPASLRYRLGWDAYRQSDACVVLTRVEGDVLRYVFNVADERLHVVPNGVEDVFFEVEADAKSRGEWLVCTATITERKRVLELAHAAVAAQVPVWVIGKPYSETDRYAQAFMRVAAENPRWVRYEGAINNRRELARIYRQARGFVLLSATETLSLSSLEAAACKCPLLLSDLPWARTTFGSDARYCPVTRSTKETAECLRAFYAGALNVQSAFPVKSWKDIGLELKTVYQSVLRTSS